MRRRSGIRSSGGYSPKSVANGSTKHDGQDAKYLDDQRRGIEVRERDRLIRRQLVIDDFEQSEALRWRALMPPKLEVDINKACLVDRHGKPISGTDRQERMQHLVTDRSWYIRSGGKRQRLRSQPCVRDRDTGKPLRDPKTGRKIRRELDAAQVPVIYHDSYQLDPRVSRALVLAAGEGLLDLVAQFVRAGAADVVEFFETFTGLRVEMLPFHAKILAGHYQPDIVVVDPNHKKLGSFDGLIHMGKAMCGVARFRRMGLPAEEVDRYTVHGKGSYEGLDDAMQDRGSKSVDLYIEKGLDERTLARLKEPAYAGLLPYYEQASTYYADYLRRRAEAFAGASDERVRAAEDRAEKAEMELTSSKARAVKAERHLATQNLNSICAARRADFRSCIQRLASGKEVRSTELSRLGFSWAGRFVSNWDIFRVLLAGGSPSPSVAAEVKELREMLEAQQAGKPLSVAPIVRADTAVSTRIALLEARVAAVTAAAQAAEVRAMRAEAALRVAEQQNQKSPEAITEALARIEARTIAGEPISRADGHLLGPYGYVHLLVQQHLSKLSDQTGNDGAYGREGLRLVAAIHKLQDEATPQQQSPNPLLKPLDP